jgi:hypothetical protein
MLVIDTFTLKWNFDDLRNSERTTFLCSEIMTITHRGFEDIVSGLRCLGKVTGTYNKQDEARIIIQGFERVQMDAFKAGDLTIVLNKEAFTQDCNMDVDESVYRISIVDMDKIL